jgi:endonuclease/exonuclease/phosphatase family metal-dependent hydrolase
LPLSQKPLRIVSYNVRYFGHALRGLGGTAASQRGIARALARLDPQPGIICLQEVETTSMRSTWAHRHRAPHETQLECFMEEWDNAQKELGRSCVHEALYFRAHDYKVGNRSFYTTGLAILVDTRRVTIDHHNVESPQHITHHHIARVKDRKQARICAHLRVKDQAGQLLHIFNTHLSLPTPFERGFWRRKDKMGFGPNQLEEAKTLCAFVKRLAGDDPYIVCGDFNSPPESPVYQHLTTHNGMAAAQAVLGQAATLRGFPTAGFMHLRMHLDHIFSGPRVKWLDLQDTRPFGDPAGPFHGLSDHVPLMGSFIVET